MLEVHLFIVTYESFDFWSKTGSFSLEPEKFIGTDLNALESQILARFKEFSQEDVLKALLNGYASVSNKYQDTYLYYSSHVFALE